MRTGCNVRPQSSTSGCGRSRNCVSTVPTEPAAGFDADEVILAIISLLSRRFGVVTASSCVGGRLSDRCMIRGFNRRKEHIMALATVNNGVNVQALLDAREALKGAPAAAQFTWRASCKWQNG